MCMCLFLTAQNILEAKNSGLHRSQIPPLGTVLTSEDRYPQMLGKSHGTRPLAGNPCCHELSNEFLNWEVEPGKKPKLSVKP